jgi:hypothetical protein
MNVLAPIWKVVSEKAIALSHMTWDATKATGKVIKAHPYKTVLAALAAAATVSGIVMYVGTSLPPGVITRGALDTFMKKLTVMYHSVKFPGKAIYTTASKDGNLIFATVEKAGSMELTTATASKMGWTASSVRAIGNYATKVWNSFKTASKAIWEHVIKPVEKVAADILFVPKDLAAKVNEKTSMRTSVWIIEKIAGAAYYSILFKIVTNLYHVVKDIVVNAFRTVRDTFTSLTPVFSTNK